MATTATSKFVGTKLRTQERGMGLKEAHAAFLRWQEQQRRTRQRTRDEYSYDINQLYNWLAKHKNKQPQDIFYNEVSEEDVRGFLQHLLGKDISENSRRKVWRSLKCFFRWVSADHQCSTMKMQGWQHLLPTIGKTKGRIFIPRDEDMHAFHESFDQSLIWGLRDYALITVLLDCGARIGEMCNLNLEDILWDKAKLMLRGKTEDEGEERLVPVSADTTLPQLGRWLRERERLAKTNAVFITKTGGRCVANTFDQSFRHQRIVTGIGNTAEGTISPHTLRHYFCTKFLMNGGSLEELQAITGHTSLDTLKIYLHLAKEQDYITKVHEKASPLTNLKAKMDGKKRKMLRD